MSRIVVLGSTGMLGHKMLERLRLHYMDVEGISRKDGLWIGNREATDKLFRGIKPEVVINCVGHIKQRQPYIKEMIQVNSLFPHYLRDWCEDWGARLIHFSTDCVFSGKKGNYTELDIPDPEDMYGQTKVLGEVAGLNTLTLRTSIVGRERNQYGNYRGLLEWFLKQKGEVQGYNYAIFSGVTTNWLADVTATLLQQKSLEGLYNVSSFPVSKCCLLDVFKEVYNKKDVTILPVSGPMCDRSLDGSKFEAETGIYREDLFPMIAEQAEQDKGLYAV